MSHWVHSPGRSAHRRTRPAARYRPSLECLEDRCILSFLGYLQTNLVSDIEGIARHTDTQLVNPWGLAYGPGGPFWVSENNAGVSTLYSSLGQKQHLVVNIPAPPSAPPGSVGTPTGVVFNATGGFDVSQGGRKGSSVFIFATEDGTIVAWSPGVEFNQAIIAVDNSTNPTAADGAVYKGLTMGTDSAHHTNLYAADFRHGTVDVFNKQFQSVTLSGSFQDPTLPKGYAPFGIQNINGDIFVTYAKQDAAKHDDVAGAGHGFIDEYTTDGVLVRRFATRGTLDSPWGMALAPRDFGPFSHDLLVGNFGDGRINAFNLTTGHFDGQLTDLQGNPITIGGLWGLKFGNGGLAGPRDKLFFSAGINDEGDGLFGSIGAFFRNSASAAAADPVAGTTSSTTPMDTAVAGFLAMHSGMQGSTLAGTGGVVSSQGAQGMVFSESDAWMLQHAMAGDLAAGTQLNTALGTADSGGNLAGLDNVFAAG
jgi:uncharacterized protein (TIGR03118 family)